MSVAAANRSLLFKIDTPFTRIMGTADPAPCRNARVCRPSNLLNVIDLD
jgi:hypothetical protein